MSNINPALYRIPFSVVAATPMTVSIKDVARAAGVSAATVSRALGVGAVSDTLRAQVEAAVAETGYRPNLFARRLRSRRAQTLGLIVADIRNPFFSAVSRAVEDAAYKAGLRVILCNTDEDPAKEALYLKLMEEERVTGAIFAPTHLTADRLAQTAPAFPIVLIDRAAEHGDIDAVALDNHGAAALLVEHLYGQGYWRIAGLFGDASTTGVERHRGYLSAMTGFGLTPNAIFIPPSTAAAEAEVARLIGERGAVASRPDAIIASNGLILMGVVRAVRGAGLNMPDDLAVAGFDNESWTELVGPGITVIEQPVDAMGRAAVAMLFDRIEHPNAPMRRTVLSGRFIPRGSTMRRP